MGTMFEDHSKVTDEEVKDAKEQAIKNNLGVEELDVSNMSDEELDILLANSSTINKKVEALIRYFEEEGKQRIVEEIVNHTSMKFSEAMLAYESLTDESDFFEE